MSSLHCEDPQLLLLLNVGAGHKRERERERKTKEHMRKNVKFGTLTHECNFVLTASNSIYIASYFFKKRKKKQGGGGQLNRHRLAQNYPMWHDGHFL